MSNPEFSSLWARLRGHGHLWHRTALSSLEDILRDREIVPNEGQFPVTYGQSNASLGRKIGAVSLFDFDTEAESNVLEHVWDYAPKEVLIRIRRDALDQTKLLLPSQVSKRAHESSPAVFVPEVEALYIGSIPASAFIGFILVALNGQLRWKEEEATADTISILTDIDRRWKAEKAQETAERHARGEHSWAEIVTEAIRQRTID